MNNDALRAALNAAFTDILNRHLTPTRPAAWPWLALAFTAGIVFTIVVISAAATL